ncbi:hypothetical protein [Streptomyces sp. SAI-127]|uniref:hypothetical protein n=1 Tax=Streptomyces sp. SAI-127 TaxID=2940543 RepID=UPI002476C7F5|nr:hypothetical protein [Streptomyces sp. SAI-127]MDH6489661.1 hypothetical protein [Streptomyces sp. SAI-127]
MPVEPLPCGPDGGTGTPGACACAPSIATSPLCRADGTPILIVLRSPCATCGTPAPDPAVIGWVDPLTGVFTAGAVPAGAGPCTGTPSDACSCAPSITSMPLCRPDGSTIALIIRSACTDCGAVAPDPGLVGWLDPVTGLFTPGPAPADATPCQVPGCLDTLCRQRCDDTTGDGTPDTTYSELWCIRADGSADLILTYQDDPSTPYVPVAPVDCTYGCPENETVMLCDEGGPFLRRYTFVAGTASFEDVALDGQTPHVVQGQVGPCPNCAPTPPIATVGLCLADGTPIAVVVTRDCDGNTTRDGWLNLTSGVWNAGAPPAGTGACSSPGAFELAGILCDTDPATGEVLGLVLVQYAYNPDGSLAGVTLVDPATGNPYALQGELRNCPTGQAQPEADLVLLCDIQADGTATPFVRDYRRDENTQIVGHTDYTLDGAGYLPTGTVGKCPTDVPGPVPVIPQVFHGELVLCDDNGPFIRKLVQDPDGTVTSVVNLTLDGAAYAPVGTVGQCTEACRDASTLLLCDVPTDGTPAPTVTDTPGAPYYPYTTGVATPGAQALWDGGTLTLPEAAGPQPGTGGTVRTAAAILQAPRPVCDAGTARVSVQVDVTQLGPDNGCRATGFLALYNGTGESNRIGLALTPPDTPAGWSGTLTVEADVPADDLAAGNIAAAIAFDAYDDSGVTCPPPRHTGWQLDQFAATVVYDQTGCATQYLSTVTTDCETGAVLTVTNTTLDGAPYDLTGEPGQCTPASSGGTVTEPCGDTEIAQLCDLTYDPQAPIPTPASDFTLTGNVVAANNGTTLWFAQANQPANGVAELTVGGLLPATLYEFRFASAWIGAGAPNPANNNAIYLLEVLDGTTVLATRTRNTSNGSTVFPGGVLTEDLPPLAFIAPATGAVTIRFTDQTTGGPVNDRDLFLMPIEVRTAVLTVTRTPFLRRFTFDCDGVLTSTEDLGLDGVTPYAVQGEAGQCAADGATAGAVTPCDAQNVIEACRCDDADGDGVPEVGYVELLAVDCTGTLSSVGTYLPDYSAPYAPVAPMDCDAGQDEGAPPAFGVQAGRVVLAPGESWDGATVPTLQAVTVRASGGTGTVTTADGTSPLLDGEEAAWTVARDVHARLTGPLTITATDGTVTVTYTKETTL